MRLDLEYIDNWSFWLDVKIFLLTIPPSSSARSEVTSHSVGGAEAARRARSSAVRAVTGAGPSGAGDRGIGRWSEEVSAWVDTNAGHHAVPLLERREKVVNRAIRSTQARLDQREVERGTKRCSERRLSSARTCSAQLPSRSPEDMPSEAHSTAEPPDSEMALRSAATPHRTAPDPRAQHRETNAPRGSLERVRRPCDTRPRPDRNRLR